MSGLQPVDFDDGKPPRCTYCSREAVGPCASCHRMVCGNCCTLTAGGVKTYAICLECDRKNGRSLFGPWTKVVLWLLIPLVLLLGIVLVLTWLGGGRY